MGVSFTRRFAANAGFLAIVVMVASFLLEGNPPATDASIAEIGEFLGDNQDMHRISVLLGFLIAIPFTVLAAGLVQSLRQESEGVAGWGTVVLFGVVVVGIGAMTAQASSGALFLDGGEGLSEGSVRALFNYTGMGYAATGVGVAIAGLASFAATRAGAPFAGWYGWLSLLAGVAGIVALFGVTSVSATFGLTLVGFIGLMLWILGTSIALFQRA